ncbi:hypothetical protein BH23ACT3_BH23ACT3_06780 [soil metagenome]
MRDRRLILIAAALLVLSACSAVAESGTTASSTEPAGEPLDDTTTVTDTTDLTDTTDTTGPTAPATTSPTTTTTEPSLDVYDPDCVVVVAPGESLSLIADRFDDDTVRPSTIIAENDLGDEVIHPGQLLDVCVDNGLDDITGEQRTEPNAALVGESTRLNVEMQQEHLNVLFDGYGIPPLLVDGVSGPVTRQRLCAARVAFGLDVSTADMGAGSDEENLILSSDTLPVPFTSSILSERWILIDQTCQIMFVGEGTDDLVFVFGTSTGEAGHETRDQDLTQGYRYDPALQNDGWHNSTTFPVEEDNPLNGNMYRPLYFDGGQAIHGANNVPTSPQSKGCARLRVEHQDALIAWLGLDDIGGPTYDQSRMNVTVNVQGAYDHG